MPQLSKRPIFARSESHFLPGMFLLGAAADYQNVPDAINGAKRAIESITATLSPAEMDRARNEVLSELVSMSAKPESQGDGFLDVDTYQLTTNEDPVAILNNSTPADLQRLAARLLRPGAAATVVVGNVEQLKTALQGRFPLEVLGEVPAPVKPANPSVKP